MLDWGPVSRWWHGNAPEWDIVSESLDRSRVLLGEAKHSNTPIAAGTLERLLRDVAERPAPDLPARYARHARVRALFVPALARGVPRRRKGGVFVVTAEDLLT